MIVPEPEDVLKTSCDKYYVWCPECDACHELALFENAECCGYETDWDESDDCSPHVAFWPKTETETNDDNETD